VLVTPVPIGLLLRRTQLAELGVLSVAFSDPAPVSGVFLWAPFMVVAVFAVVEPFGVILVAVLVAMFLLRGRTSTDSHWGGKRT
jgi:hypothetical protein